MTDVQERVGMPLDEFIEQGNEQPFEIINGERIPKLPTVGGHNYIMHLLYQLLFTHLTANNLGRCFMEATYIRPDQYLSNWVTGSRIPDLLVIAAERWSAYLEANTDWRDKPYSFVPDLVIEVISPTDKFTQVYEKVDAYLSDGVRLIVLIDPQRRTAEIHDPNAEQPLHLSGEATLDLSHVIPGFHVALPALFE